jgi:hypothetical protein
VAFPTVGSQHPMHSAPSRCSGSQHIEAGDGIMGRRKQSQESRARLRARASFRFLLERVFIAVGKA